MTSYTSVLTVFDGKFAPKSILVAVPEESLCIIRNVVWPESYAMAIMSVRLEGSALDRALVVVVKPTNVRLFETYEASECANLNDAKNPPLLEAAPR